MACECDDPQGECDICCCCSDCCTCVSKHCYCSRCHNYHGLWVDISKKYPPEDYDVLFYIPLPKPKQIVGSKWDNNIISRSKYGVGLVRDGIKEATHWQHLPQSPV